MVGRFRQDANATLAVWPRRKRIDCSSVAVLRRASQVHFRAAKFHARQTWLAGVQRLAAQANWHGERTEQRWADWRAWVGWASWIGAADRISAVAQRRLQPLHLAPSFGLARLATVTHSLLVTSSLLLCIRHTILLRLELDHRLHHIARNLTIELDGSRLFLSFSLISTILRPPSPLHFGFSIGRRLAQLVL